MLDTELKKAAFKSAFTFYNVMNIFGGGFFILLPWLDITSADLSNWDAITFFITTIGGFFFTLGIMNLVNIHRDYKEQVETAQASQAYIHKK